MLDPRFREGEWIRPLISVHSRAGGNPDLVDIDFCPRLRRDERPFNSIPVDKLHVRQRLFFEQKDR
jgi:hypothetical protein